MGTVETSTSMGLLREENRALRQRVADLEGTLARMFDPFFSTKALGRGLGLAAVSGILKAHGAGLQALAGPQGGLTLRLYFPPGRA